MFSRLQLRILNTEICVSKILTYSWIDKNLDASAQNGIISVNFTNVVFYRTLLSTANFQFSFKCCHIIDHNAGQ